MSRKRIIIYTGIILLIIFSFVRQDAYNRRMKPYENLFSDLEELFRDNIWFTDVSCGSAQYGRLFLHGRVMRLTHHEALKKSVNDCSARHGLESRIVQDGEAERFLSKPREKSNIITVYMNVHIVTPISSVKPLLWDVKSKDIIIGDTKVKMVKVDSAYLSNKNTNGKKLTAVTPFWIAETEVTQELWENVMGYNPSVQPHSSSNPISRVSYTECQKFIKALNARDEDSPRYRLPSVGEWECAVTGGILRDYGVGCNDSNLVDYAWFRKNSGHHLNPVATRLPNVLGLYDMHGNVAEWCESELVSTGVAIAKGGSIISSAEECAQARRERHDFIDHLGNFGLRLCMDVRTP